MLTRSARRLLPALALGALLVPASAHAAENACNESLDPDRRSVYPFKSGSKTLPFGRVVVQATSANRHRYCVKVQFNGKTPLNAFSQSTDVRRDGRWVYEGGLGDGFHRSSGYTRTIIVRDKTRYNLSYSIKRTGRIYSTITIRRFNL